MKKLLPLSVAMVLAASAAQADERITILNYQCVNGRMTRDPYLNAFDAEGYQSAQWKPIR